MSTTQVAIKRYEMLIDGEFVSTSKMLSVVNPATEEVVSEFPCGTAADADRAVLAAEKAQKEWAALPAIRRAGYLREIANLLRANRESLAHTITEEQGKILGLAQVEVDFSADYLDYMAEFARRYEGEIIQSDRPGEKHPALQDAHRRHCRHPCPGTFPSSSSCAKWRRRWSRATLSC